MTVRLDFDASVDLTSPSGAVPVYFSIGWTDLLGDESDRERGGSHGGGLPLALLHFSTWGLVCLRHARRSGRYAIELDDYGDPLLFIMQDDDIVVHSPRWGKTATAPYAVLHDAWLNFATRTRDFIVRRFPAAIDDPRWRRLTADDRSPEWLESAISPWWFAASDARRDPVGTGHP